MLLSAIASTYSFIDLLPLLFAQVVQIIPRLLLLRPALLGMLWRLWAGLVLSELDLSFIAPRYCLAELLYGRRLSELWVVWTGAIGEFRRCRKGVSRWKGWVCLRPGSHFIMLKRYYRVQAIMPCCFVILVSECRCCSSGCSKKARRAQNKTPTVCRAPFSVFESSSNFKHPSTWKNWTTKHLAPPSLWQHRPHILMHMKPLMHLWLQFCLAIDRNPLTDHRSQAAKLTESSPIKL
jgi:hypothetical protein